MADRKQPTAFQVVMAGFMRDDFVAWLASRGFVMVAYRINSEEDVNTYMVTPSQELVDLLPHFFGRSGGGQ